MKSPMGTIVIRNGYKYQKCPVRDDGGRRWRRLHHIVWEEHNGPIPKGKCVTFKDGNQLNCDISNLMLASRAELMKIVKDGLALTPSPGEKTRELCLNLAKLELAVSKRRKKK